jgi:hypothetical protein
MPSTYTPNKDLEMPASGSYNNAWAAPLNNVIDNIDSCLGGTATISVTGASGNVTLSVGQYQPVNIEFTGTLTANVTYLLPASVGGVWTIYNAASGAFTIKFGTSYNQIAITYAQRAYLVSDGTSVGYADTQFAQSAANTAQAAAIAAAEAYASNASNLASGTVANAVLPNLGLSAGVTIAANPGTTPSGSPGDVWFYY